MFGGKSAVAPSQADTSSRSSIVSTTPDQRFSLPFIKKIHQQLVENKNIKEDNEELVIEILRVIAEMVVYGDNKSELLFDFFCEKNMLSLFLELMWAENGCPISVHVQVLQTLSILINSVKNDTSLYYLLSNNFVNEMIVYPHDFNNPDCEALRDQFVSFMKSLSLRLNNQTVQFFFIEETGAFPLLSRAIEMLHFNEPMVRIASQSTILNVFKVYDARARDYALQDDIVQKFFSQVTLLMDKLYSSLFRVCNEAMTQCVIDDESAEIKNFTKFEIQFQDVLVAMEDWFYYLQDVFELKIMKLRRAMVHYLLTEFIYPVLLAPLLSIGKIKRPTSNYQSPPDSPSPTQFAPILENHFRESFQSSNTTEPFLASAPKSSLSHNLNMYDASRVSDNEDKNTTETNSKIIDRDPILAAEGANCMDGIDSPCRDSEGPFNISTVLMNRMINREVHGITPPLVTRSVDPDVRFSNREDDYSSATKNKNPLSSTSKSLGIAVDAGTRRDANICAAESQNSASSILRSRSFQSISPMFGSFLDTFTAKSSAATTVQDVVSVEICISLIVATTMLNQILRIVTDTMFHRAVMVAILHPLSRSGRKKFLNHLTSLGLTIGEKADLDDDVAQLDTSFDNDCTIQPEFEDRFDPISAADQRDSNPVGLKLKNADNLTSAERPAELSLHSSDINPYRIAFSKLFEPGHERVALLASYLLHSMEESLAGSLSSSGDTNNVSSYANNIIRICHDINLWIDDEIYYESKFIDVSHGSVSAVAASLASRLGSVDGGGALSPAIRSPLKGLDEPIPLDRVTSLNPEYMKSLILEDETFERMSVPKTPPVEEGAEEQSASLVAGVEVDDVDIDFDSFNFFMQSLFERGEDATSLSSENIHKIIPILSIIKASSVATSNNSGNGSVAFQLMQKFSKDLDGPMKESSAVGYIDSDVLSIHKIMGLRYCMNICQENESIDVRMHDQNERTKKEGSGESETPLSLICPAISARNSVHRSFSHTLFDVLLRPTEYPLVLLQVNVQTIYGRIRMIQLGLNNLEKVRNSISEYNNAQLLTMEHLGRTMLYMLREIRLAGRLAATALLNYLTDSNAILQILQEELRRMTSAKWSRVFNQMMQDSLLLFPSSEAIKTKFGSEHTVPTTLMDSLRHKIQIFILIRSLYLQARRILANPTGETSSKDDLGNNVIDKVWRGFTERGLLPADYTHGKPVKMKGKRFLDVYVLQSSGSNPQSIATPSISELPQATPPSTSFFSSFGFGLSRRTSFSTGSGGNGNSSNADDTRGLRHSDLLFVQDKSLLIICKPVFENAKAGFNVFISTPLMHTEASISPNNSTLLKIIVRSWDNLQNFDKVGPDLEDYNQSAYPHSASPSLLAPRKDCCVFKVSIGFEAEQACALAMTHINTRRQHIRNEKLHLLRVLLEKWSNSALDGGEY